MIKYYSFPINAILLLGPTGVGKSPLGDSIAGNGLFGRRCHHLDFGLELRGAVSDENLSGAYSKEELDFIHGVLERGLLLENENFSLARKIIFLFLNRVGFIQRDILVLNGIPRHTGQARDIEVIAFVHALIVLDCSADDVFYRITNNIGRDRTERVDDNKELIEKKMVIFRERTAPLIDHYSLARNRIYRLMITGSTTPEMAYQELLSFTAAYPPVSLVAEPPK